MNVSDIFARVARIFGDESGVQLTLADVINWVNDAQRKIAVESELLQVKAQSDVISGQLEYEKPSDNMLNLRSIRWNGIRLLGIGMQEADQRFPNYDVPGNQEAGNPAFYWSWGDIIYIYPVPDAYAALGLTMYYTRQPIPVALSTDVPELAEIYHDRIIDYVLRCAYEMDENIQAATFRQTLYTEGMQTLGELENKVNDEAYETIFIRDEDL